MLLTIFFLLSVTIVFMAFFAFGYPRFSKIVFLTTTASVLVLSCELLVVFDNSQLVFQEVFTLSAGPQSLNVSYSFGLDGLSLIFFFLSALLIFLCIIFIWNEVFFLEYALNLLLIELFLLVVFTVLDLFIFYVFFEAVLVPMFLIIGINGSRERKIRAVYLFFFYTLCGSMLMLISILYIYMLVGTLSLEYLVEFNFTDKEQKIFFFIFFISFASKIPMFPFHLWLPEAHVEAPTVGSVLLAGILLKLGVYGFLRFSLVLFPEASFFFAPMIYLFSILGVIYGSLTALRQTDLKRVIAYSSIAHMNMVTLGLFSFSTVGLEGCVLQSLSHGFVAGGLFFIIGIIYSRYHIRELQTFGGIVLTMPTLSTFFLLFTLANIAVPGSSSFVGEFLLLLSIFKESPFVGSVVALSVMLCGSYSLWLYNRVVFGNLKIDYTRQFLDITEQETVVLLPLLFFIVLIGLCPVYALDWLHVSVNFVII